MSKTLYTIQHTQAPELVTLKFRLQYVTNLAADFQLPAGSIASNTRSSAGVYTMTLNEIYPVFLGGRGDVMTTSVAANVADCKVQFGVGDYNTTTGVLTYRVLSTDGTVAVQDVANDDWIYFELTFCRRSTMAPVGALT